MQLVLSPCEVQRDTKIIVSQDLFYLDTTCVQWTIISGWMLFFNMSTNHRLFGLAMSITYTWKCPKQYFPISPLCTRTPHTQSPLPTLRLRLLAISKSYSHVRYGTAHQLTRQLRDSRLVSRCRCIYNRTRSNIYDMLIRWCNIS